MRTSGIALLLVAFGWLCVQQVGLHLVGGRPGGLRVLLSQLDAKPSGIYSREEAERIGRAAVKAQADINPNFVVPGIFMLSGGLMIGWSTRSRNGKNAT